MPRHGAVFYCRAGHHLLREAAPNIEQVFAFPFVCTKLPARAAQLFYRLAKTGVIDPDTGDYLPPIKADTIALAKAIVLSSDAISLAPLGLIAGEVQSGRLVALPFEEPWMHTRYGFVHLKDRALSPVGHAFVAETRTAESERVETERRISATTA